MKFVIKTENVLRGHFPLGVLYDKEKDFLDSLEDFGELMSLTESIFVDNLYAPQKFERTENVVKFKQSNNLIHDSDLHPWILTERK